MAVSLSTIRANRGKGRAAERYALPVVLCRAISRLAGDGSLRKTYGDASRELVLERFSDERNIQEIFDVYRRIGALS